jgi:ketosteroid isomerase-like protein
MDNTKSEEVKKVLLGIFEAARDKDFEKLARLNDWNGKYTKFSDMPPLERLEGERAKHFDIVLYTNITDYTCVVEDLKTEFYGNCAVATCYLSYGGILVNDYSFEAQRFTAKSRATFVLEQRRGQWVVVHQHLSSMGDSNTPLFDSDANSQD